MDRPHGLDAGDFSDAAVVEYLRQWAPFNLVDGAWLQRILNTGPCNEVQANLFAIWVDEAGNGKTELNHCNVYDTLLRSVNVYLPPITSHEFIEQDFLPSAFTSSVFQMSVGLFPQDLLPELLGMTLFLEWESTPVLAPTVRLLAGRRIDPRFYRLHVAIDNIASGHGALAKRAITLFLDDAADKGGDAAVQAQWDRIWNGYVTWATTGTFGADLARHLRRFDGKIPSQRKAYARQRMVDLISRKAPAAKKSHGRARLGGRPLKRAVRRARGSHGRAGFEDPPEEMMAAMARSQFFMAGSVDRSSFFTDVVGPQGFMAGILDPVDEEVIRRWVAAGCPVPGTAVHPANAPDPESSDGGEAPVLADVPFFTRRLTIGQGGIH